MNKTRMKKIARLADKLRDIQGEIENVLIEEIDFRDGIKNPDSERYERSKEACEILGEVMGYVEDAFTRLEDCVTEDL